MLGERVLGVQLEYAAALEGLRQRLDEGEGRRRIAGQHDPWLVVCERADPRDDFFEGERVHGPQCHRADWPQTGTLDPIGGSRDQGRSMGRAGARAQSRRYETCRQIQFCGSRTSG